MDYRGWYNLRHKESKTEQEELLLELRKTIGVISEILVNYDKGNYSEEGAIKDIGEVLGEVTHKL